MKTVIKGKKKTSISINGDTICWSSVVDYDCRKLPKKEADVEAEEAANELSSKTSENYSSLTISSDSTTKCADKDLLKDASNDLTKKVVTKSDAEVQCSLDKHDSTAADDISFDVVKTIYHELDAVFLKRINEIETQLPNDLELQIKTHEEWCKNLIKSSKTITESLRILKTDFESFAKDPLDVSKSELKFELDCDSLVKLIKRRVQTGEWFFEDIELETLPFKEILNPDSDYLSEVLSSPHGDSRSRAKLKSPFTKSKT